MNIPTLVAVAVASIPIPAGSALAESAAQKGLAIAQRVDRVNNGFRGEESAMELVLINAHGDETVRRMISIVAETQNDGDRSRIEFEWPADVKGTRMLTWTHKKGNDDQWLYLPALKRVKRITSRNKSGSFMGSEFSYEDLNSQEVEKFRHEFVSEEKLNGRDTWKQIRVPVDKKSGYSKQVVWIDKGYMNAVRIDYYDRKGDLLKQAEFSGFKKYGKFWRASTINVANRRTRKRSRLTWKTRKLNVEHDEDQFDNDELAD